MLIFHHLSSQWGGVLNAYIPSFEQSIGLSTKCLYSLYLEVNEIVY